MYSWVHMRSHENNHEDICGTLHGDSESLSYNYIFIVSFFIVLSLSYDIIQSHNGSFTLDDNNVKFLCRQKWVEWISVLRFTLGHEDKMKHHHCCQWNLFLIHRKVVTKCERSLNESNELIVNPQL